ncbi:MAG: DUF494 domain-containing protein [Proteobacteria bacterium]|jgi:Smg protein|nr:DUF494 domain-containing protein [Pseudomonadota bacterium]
MKEGVLDILIYLFENYFDAETEDGFEPDRETLKLELEKAGFPGSEVERALCWLEELAADPDRSHPTPTSRAIRVFAALEQARLDTDCRGYLVHLEQVGILSPTQRELVIDRLMALEGDEIDIDKLKWVVLMVLFSQPGQETAFSRMEDLVFEDHSGAIH